MPHQLIQELQAVLPAGMPIPQPIMQLYEWLESQGLYEETEEGTTGFLYPQDKLLESWTESGREGGTAIEFIATGQAGLRYLFGKESEEVNRRLCVFGQTGDDGSQCALWLADDGQVKIVHLGSGSGSGLVCVLADDAVDFLRLLAIGYAEICWPKEFALPPSALEEFVVTPNTEFQEWVKNTFQVTIPRNALEIIRHPTNIDDEASADAFFTWCRKITG